jgi:hypothetical protein
MVVPAYRGTSGISDQAGERLMDDLDALYFAAHREVHGSTARRLAIARYNALLAAAQRRFVAWFDFDEWLDINEHRYLTTPIDP